MRDARHGPEPFPQPDGQVPDPIDTPAVWYGDELLKRPDWLWTLNDGEIEELIRAADAVSGEITRDSFVLPTVAHRLLAVQHSLESGSGATMIRGFPAKRCSEQQANRVFWGMVQHVGTPVSQSATGERVFHVRDQGYLSDDPRARGPNTRKRLSFHTDRCDVIASANVSLSLSRSTTPASRST